MWVLLSSLFMAAVLAQQFGHVGVALRCRHVQRRLTILVLAKNQIGMVLEQLFDSFQVTIPHCPKNDGVKYCCVLMGLGHVLSSFPRRAPRARHLSIARPSRLDFHGQRFRQIPFP